MSSRTAGFQEKRRSRVVIERDFQYRVTLRICLIAGLMLVAFGTGLLFLVKLSYEMLVQNALLQMPEMVSSLQREFRLVSLGIVTAFIVMIGIMVGLGLVLTQRLAGPLYAFKRQLQAFSDGRSGVRLSLRLGDEFAGLAVTFNEAMERADERSREINTQLREALGCLSNGKPAETAARLQKIIDGQMKNPRGPEGTAGV